MAEGNDVPEGYVHEPLPSPFLNHIGTIFTKKVTRKDGTVESWSAVHVQPHQVNSWGMAHGGLIACMAEIGTGSAGWDPNGPPCVAIDLNIQFIGAPRLDDLLEVCGTVTKRTRSLVFTAARGEVGGAPVFVATSVQKIIDR